MSITVPSSTGVHCRTGSLEIAGGAGIVAGMVHCRTGSLEIAGICSEYQIDVHCRTGSLEIAVY